MYPFVPLFVPLVNIGGFGSDSFGSGARRTRLTNGLAKKWVESEAASASPS